MLRTYTANQTSRTRLRLKSWMFPGTNWVNRDKARLTKMFLSGTRDRPIRTLDCGCGNAYFAHQAVLRGARCLGITIHDWERQNCEEMRDFLGIPEDALEFRVCRLDELAADPDQHGKFDQVLLLDVIEHIMDAHKAFRQIHDLLDENGFVYVTTPDRDWQAHSTKIRVTPVEDGWHVRNGYTFEQLEKVMEESGFEPIDRLRLGTVGSTVVTWIQHTLFRSRNDLLTVLFYPLLKLLAVMLSPWRDSHTVFVLARKGQSGFRLIGLELLSLDTVSIKDDCVSTFARASRLVRHFTAARTDLREEVLVACPDARAPAYQAVVGLVRAGWLRRFVTAFYYSGDGRLTTTGRRLAPDWYARWEPQLRRRQDPEIPARRVESDWGFDLALAAERQVAARRPEVRLRLARWRTERFDRVVARALVRERPGVALVFSDVASEVALPECKRLGIATVLSMVHGDVREERQVLETEAEAAPDFFPIYLGSGAVDPQEMAWLHERRLRDIELADRILVPSEHIAGMLERHGTPRQRIAVVPYAADTRRFVPDPSKTPGASCTFLFAGGITQRKGIKYLLEAWRRIRRPGWRLQLLGALPADPGPLAPYRDEVEWLGKFSHAAVATRMAKADVFVFPSLFEGSAVVTYEAMSCGLPCIVTAEAGSVVRHGEDGLIVPARDVEALAAAMERLGTDAPFRAACAASARAQAEAHDWPRYHALVNEAVRHVAGCGE